MSHSIKDLLSGNARYNDALGTVPQHAGSYSAATIIPNAFTSLGGQGITIEVASTLLQHAWNCRNTLKKKQAARYVLLAAPLFYPVSLSNTLITILPETDFTADVGGSFVDIVPTVETPVAGPSTAIGERVGDAVTIMKGSLPVFPIEGLSAQEVTALFATVGVLPWRGLVKSIDVRASPWVTSATGIFQRTIQSIKSCLEDREHQAYDQLVGSLIDWYANQNPSDLLSMPHASLMIRILVSPSVIIPPYIAASIQSVWRYHGMAPYVLLREASRVLNISPLQILKMSACPILNNTILGLLELMEAETKDNTGLFAYCKILNSALFPSAASKTSINFLYWIRQLIEPRDPNAIGEGTGIWQKICESPGTDIKRILHTAALKLRSKTLYAPDRDLTSNFMYEVLEEMSSLPIAVSDVLSDPDDLALGDDDLDPDHRP
ncbi:MAG: hypothetical protein [Barnaclevirus sp.]